MSVTTLERTAAVTLQDGAAANPLQRKSDFTGMIFCPLKMSGMAIMACWQHQKDDGCGFRCPAKVARGDVLAVITAATQDANADESSIPVPARSVCPVCGGEKVKTAKTCIHCRGRRPKVVRA